MVEFQGLDNKLSCSMSQQGSGELNIGLYRGNYLVTAFADENGNSDWDLGTLEPFRFAEPGWVVADTLRIRARFEHSGLSFRFK
jgi:hypothetical protein